MTDKFLITSDDVERIEEEKKPTITITVEKGGAGSGHWGHAGRPGRIGGSVPGSIALSVRTGRTARSRQREAKFDAAISTGSYQTIDEYHAEGVTASQRLILEDHGNVIMKAIDDSVGPDSINAEVEIYEISQQLGWDSVPETEIVILDKDVGDMRTGQPVSIQSWINDSELIGDFHYADPRIDKRSYSRVRLLDFISGNRDRHDGNIVIDADGNSHAIDNNRAFWGEYSVADVNDVKDWTSQRVFKSGEPSFHPHDVKAVTKLVLEDDVFYNRISDTYGADVALDMSDRITNFKHEYDIGNYGVLE